MANHLRTVRSAFLLIAGSPAPLLAQGAPKSAELALAKQAEQLKPGQWVWAPKIAPAGPILVYVDLGRQLATVYRNGVRIGVSTISSGRDGYETPTGVFTILEKNKEHISHKFNDAPMPYQERLTWSGVALHAGGLPGYPESHGCVHLPLAFSKILFDAMPMGGTVVIAGGHEDPVKRPAAGVLAPVMAGVTPVAGNAAIAGRAIHLECGRSAERPGVDHHLDPRPAGGGAAQRGGDRAGACADRR